MTQLTEQYYAVEVPEDAERVFIRNGSYVKWLKVGGRKIEPLPDGTWKFLFTTKEMTLYQAARVVASRKEYRLVFLFKDYQTGKALDNATDSLQSLLRSKGLDTEKNYAILKKEP